MRFTFVTQSPFKIYLSSYSNLKKPKLKTQMPCEYRLDKKELKLNQFEAYIGIRK